MFASLRINLILFLLNTETQIGAGGRFSKAYQVFLLLVKYFSLIFSCSPLLIYSLTFGCSEFIPLNRYVSLSSFVNLSKSSKVKKLPFTSLDLQMHGNRFSCGIEKLIALDVLNVKYSLEPVAIPLIPTALLIDCFGPIT